MLYKGRMQRALFSAVGALLCAACGGQGSREAEPATPSGLSTPSAATAATNTPLPSASAVTQVAPASPSSPEATGTTGAVVPAGDGTFGDDVAFLQKHTALVVLGNPDGAAVAVAPEYQGRVMTSTARGAKGRSFGFIHREVVAAGARQPHMTVFGGEDRFWLGPEGGQYGLYFPPGAPYDFDHWQVPEALDWGAWNVEKKTDSEVSFTRDLVVTNHLGTEFHLRVARRVRLLTDKEIRARAGVDLDSATAAVGYESENTITNTGTAAWTKKTGLPSVWILGMFQPSPTTTVVVPFRPGPEEKLGKMVNDAYFGKIAPQRLRVGATALFFSGDGKVRGKIGIPAPRACPIAGSWDGASSVLTLVEYNLPAHPADYVDSMWQDQAEPFGGDVVNSYNDGPPAPGKKPLGPFYEIETSSPGAALAPGKSLTHVHRTIHLQGAASNLEMISKVTLGVSIAEIEGG
jgi:hypothetical protein